MTTGDVRNASTSANVFIVLYGGEDGEKNSGKLVLRNENNDNFKRDRTDIFQVETADCLSPLHHVTIGHDNTGLGAGWFCEKVRFPFVVTLDQYEIIFTGHLFSIPDRG